MPGVSRYAYATCYEESVSAFLGFLVFSVYFFNVFICLMFFCCSNQHHFSLFGVSIIKIYYLTDLKNKCIHFYGIFIMFFILFHFFAFFYLPTLNARVMYVTVEAHAANRTTRLMLWKSRSSNIERYSRSATKKKKKAQYLYLFINPNSIHDLCGGSQILKPLKNNFNKKKHMN